MSCQTSIAVVYLCRAQESKDAFHRFVNSYRRHPAGAAHELIIAFKGFDDPSQLLAAQAIFADVPYTSIEIDDSGFDIGAYLKVSQRIDHEYVCFFNTFSELISDGWLELMYRQASDPTVGIVGAMGSYEGLRSSFALINKVIWLTNTIHIDYDGNFHDHFEFVIDQHCQAWRDKQVRHAHLFRKLGDYRWVRNQLSLMRRRWRSRFGRYWRSLIRQSDFMARIRQLPGFPNAHVRSNGFMLARARLLEEVPTIAEKLDACEFESGHDSLTNRIRRQGLSAVVVGRDGVGYDVADWAHSGTFRLGNQCLAALLHASSKFRFRRLIAGYLRRLWGPYAFRAIERICNKGGYRSLIEIYDALERGERTGRRPAEVAAA